MTKLFRRTLWTIAVLAVLASVAELVLRALIPSIVAAQVREQMKLAPDAVVEVQLEGPALLPAIAGTVGPIHVRVPDVSVLQSVSTTLEVSARSVPFNPGTGWIDGANGSVLIPAPSIGPLISLLSQGVADSGKVSENVLEVSKTMQLFGQDTTMSVELSLSVDGGKVRIEPIAIQAAGFDLTASQVNEMTGGTLESILMPQELCVRDRMPAGITLTGIQLYPSGSVRISADLAGDILSNPSQQKPGVCDAPGG